MNEKLKEHLNEDEKVLWSGKAEPVDTLDPVYKPSFILKASIALVIIVVIVIALVMASKKSGTEIQFGMILIVSALAVIAPIQVLADASRVRKLNYLVTNQRLLVQRDESIRGVSFDRIDCAAFRTDKAGKTSFLCGKDALKAKEAKYREIAVLSASVSDYGEEGKAVEKFGFYALDQQSVKKLRSIMAEYCPAVSIQ